MNETTALFIVTNRTEQIIFQTNYEECIPEKEIQEQLLHTGYRIFYKSKELTEPIT